MKLGRRELIGTLAALAGGAILADRLGPIKMPQTEDNLSKAVRERSQQAYLDDFARRYGNDSIRIVYSANGNFEAAAKNYARNFSENYSRQFNSSQTEDLVEKLSSDSSYFKPESIEGMRRYIPEHGGSDYYKHVVEDIIQRGLNSSFKSNQASSLPSADGKEEIYVSGRLFDNLKELPENKREAELMKKIGLQLQLIKLRNEDFNTYLQVINSPEQK